MSKYALGILWCFLVVHLYAQSDPVLLYVNGNPVYRTEFERAYNEHYPSALCNKKQIINFLTEFTDRKLKLAEAEKLGIDETSEYQDKVSAYRKELMMRTYIAQPIDENLLAQYFEQQMKLPQPGKVLVAHIFKAIPQSCPNLEQEKIIQQMNTLYRQLTTDPQADFDEYVDQYSDDKRHFEVNWLETHTAFEEHVFSMKKGELSKPFLTPAGVHIVKILDRRDIQGDELREAFLLRSFRKHKTSGELPLIKQLKANYNYAPNSNHINELFATGHTNGVLFTLNDKAYTGEDFKFFADGIPKGVRRQFDNFVTKMLFDNERARLDKTNPEIEQLLQTFKEETLLTELFDQEIRDRSRTDRAGLTAYFSVHKKEYRWPYPRFRGMVVHSRDKKLLSKAKRLVKKMPVEEWETLVNQYFNSEGVQQVKTEQGLFEIGDNEYVDEKIFKGKRATPIPSYPFTVVIGKKVKGPDRYEEALESVIPDYEKFLEARWLSHLRSTYRVEINEEVLKTVNNH